jgi:hypothetical protein
MRRAVIDHKRRKPYEHRLVCSSPDAEDCHIVVIARHHHDRTDDVSREREGRSMALDGLYTVSEVHLALYSSQIALVWCDEIGMTFLSGG